MRENLEFIVGIHADVAAAEGDYEAVRRAYEAHRLATFDAAVVARKADGTERIYRHSAPPGPIAPTSDGVWGMATGLAVALFPSIWIGSGPATLAGSAAIGAIAACVTQGLGRDVLRDFGKRVDTTDAALIVATPEPSRESVQSEIARAESVLSRPAIVDRGMIGAILAAGGAGQAPGPGERRR